MSECKLKGENHPEPQVGVAVAGGAGVAIRNAAANRDVAPAAAAKHTVRTR